MWLGEQIDEYGLGNGISLLIMAGIVARMPDALIGSSCGQLRPPSWRPTAGKHRHRALIMFLIVLVHLVVVGVILITQASGASRSSRPSTPAAGGSTAGSASTCRCA